MSKQPSEDEGPVKRAKTYEPAITFPYELDVFQRESVDALEDGDSVLVAAHTSAGKTTVAIYAIAMALKAKQRVIYTSPIKALSNQKYRELSERFDSVGLMTGDVTMKPESDCLVMTTEILRSMLYRGSEMLREVGCVIFDEVHYMRDKIRGVAWEETIILLPDKVQFVFLSATIPNSQEFAEWIMHIHPGKKCKCIYTDYRPTPLQHYIYPAGADGMFMVVDEFQNFKTDTFQKAMSSVGQSTDGGKNASAVATKGGKKGRKGGNQAAPLAKIIKLIMARGLSPAIIFSFSKKECELYALYMSKMDFNDDEEKGLIETVFNNAIEALGEEDRQLDAVTNLLPLLKRGVGIHHSGLLPILKEIVELLFGEGLIKILFSTETFSIGLNMPARTVIFTSVRKFDGEGNRWLTSGEYVQMSGRAGRRGIDTHGLAIAMIDEAVPPDVLRAMTSGQADPLLSAFHLTYNMVLNVLRVEDIDPLYIMCRSFLQFQTDKGLPKLEAEIKQLQDKIDGIGIPQEEIVSEYFSAQKQLKKYTDICRTVITKPENIVVYLKPGRMVKMITSQGVDYDWGMLLSCNASEKVDKSFEVIKTYTVDVLVHVFNEINRGAHPTTDGRPAPCPFAEPRNGCMDVVQFTLNEIEQVSVMRMYVPPSLASSEEKSKMYRSIQAAREKTGTFQSMDPITEMKLSDPELIKALKRIDVLTKQMQKNECYNTENQELISAMSRYQKKDQLEGHINGLQKQLKTSKKVVLRNELKGMLRVLRRLEYTDADNIVRLKGRVATEISTSDENELLLCELVFANVFKTLTTNQIAALLSALVTTEKSQEGWNPKEEFKEPLQLLYEIDKRIKDIQLESGIEKTTEGEGIKPALLDITYAWMNGAKFTDICQNNQTDIYEVRVFFINL